MVAISATHSTPASLQSMVSQDRLAQARQQADQAESTARQLRQQANEAEREAQQRQGVVRDLSQRQQKADLTYPAPKAAPSPAADAGLEPILGFYQAAATLRLTQMPYLKLQEFALAASNPPGQATGRIVDIRA